jgi:hypothetical protein
VTPEPTCCASGDGGDEADDITGGEAPATEGAVAGGTLSADPGVAVTDAGLSSGPGVLFVGTGDGMPTAGALATS